MSPPSHGEAQQERKPELAVCARQPKKRRLQAAGAAMPRGCQGGAEPQRCGYTGWGGLVLLPNVGSLGRQVGTAWGRGHQQQQRRLPPGHARSLPRAGLGALADILAVK